MYMVMLLLLSKSSLHNYQVQREGLSVSSVGGKLSMFQQETKKKNLHLCSPSNHNKTQWESLGKGLQ